MGPSEVCAKYELDSPTQVIDLLALMGDSADNFPGCPGVGPKTASKLIGEFGSIDNMLASTAKIKGKLREKVESAVEDIRMSKFLATIRTDVPIELNLDALKIEEPDTARLAEIFTELEFKSLLDKFVKKPKQQQKVVNPQLDLFAENPTNDAVGSEFSSFESLKTTSHDYQLIENEEEARKLFDFFVTKQILSLDTETTSINPVDAELVGLSFAVEEGKAFYVAIPAEREKAQTIVNIFKPLYESTEILKIGQNIKYDMEVLMNYGVRLAAPMLTR